MINCNTDILFITVNEHETTKLREEFKSIGITPKSIQSTTSLEVYDDYGEINGQRIMHAISMMGSGQAGGSRETTKKAIDDLTPKLLIAVGICWGATENEQKIGDVIISQLVQTNSNLKLKDNNAIFRGARSEIDSTAIKILERAKDHCTEEIKTHVGLMISADTLFDDKKQRDIYCRGLSGLKGGEMEAMGIHEAIRESNFKPNWIVVKGICDWGYKKNSNPSQKEKDQSKAAQNSAKLCITAITKFKLINSDRTTNNAKSSSNEDTIQPNKNTPAATSRIPPITSSENTSNSNKLSARNDLLILKLQSDKNFLTIYNNFPVKLTNQDTLTLLKSRISLNLPAKISVQLSDSTDYNNLALTGYPYQREDLIEAAKLNTENRRSKLESNINWCLDVLRENRNLASNSIEQCITNLCNYSSMRKKDHALIDVVSHENSSIFFKAEVPDEVLQKIASSRNTSRPLTQFAGCDLFDLPEDIVFGHVLPYYASYRGHGRKLPEKFSMTEWWWGEA